MWLKDYCPICSSKLEQTILYSELGVDKILTKCSKTDLPNTVKELNIRCHFESFRIDDNIPYFEIFILAPYIIENYVDISNFAHYDDKYLLHHLIEVPYIELPWFDHEKVLNKIKTLILFN